MYNLIVRPLRSKAVARLLALCDAVVRDHVPPRVQRLGSQSWQRVLARWPMLGEFVGIAASVVRSAVAEQPVAAAGSPVASAVVSAETRVAALASLRDASAPWQDRVEAAGVLSRVSATDVVPGLIAALADPSAEVAAAAATALAQQPGPAAVDALRAALANAHGQLNPITRAAAVSGLAGRLGDRELAPVFEAVRDQDAEVSIAAIAALAERAPGDGELERHLLPVLRNDAGYFLPLARLAAAHALQRTGKLDAATAADLAQRESDAKVRAVLQHIADPHPPELEAAVV